MLTHAITRLLSGAGSIPFGIAILHRPFRLASACEINGGKSRNLLQCSNSFDSDAWLQASRQHGCAVKAQENPTEQHFAQDCPAPATICNFWRLQ